MSTVPKKKPKFSDLLADISQFGPTPQARAKVAAIGDGLGQDRHEESAPAAPKDRRAEELTHLNGGGEAAKRDSEVNPQGVNTGTALPGQPTLKTEELERNEKALTDGASVESPGKKASPESAGTILARFKANIKLAESEDGQGGQGGREQGSPVAAAVLEGKPAPQTTPATPATISTGAEQSLEAAAVANSSATSPEADKALGAHGKSAGTVEVNVEDLARKTAAWIQHGDYGYQILKAFFAPVSEMLKSAANLDPVGLVQSLKVAEYTPIDFDRAQLEPLVRERESQLKTAGKNDAEIIGLLKEAGEADRQALALENAVRRDERQKVAAELELQAAVLTKVAHYRAAGMNDAQISAALQKDAEADAAAMMAAGGGASPEGAAGPAGVAGGPGVPGTTDASGAAAGGIDPAELAQLEQLIQHIGQTLGLDEEQVLQMLEQQAASGGQGGGAAAPAAAGPDAGAGSPVPPGTGGDGAAPKAESDAAPAKEDKEPADDKEPKEDDDKETKEAARRLTPEAEALFAQIDALTRAGQFKDDTSSKLAHLVLAQVK